MGLPFSIGLFVGTKTSNPSWFKLRKHCVMENRFKCLSWRPPTKKDQAGLFWSLKPTHYTHYLHNYTSPNWPQTCQSNLHSWRFLATKATRHKRGSGRSCSCEKTAGLYIFETKLGLTNFVVFFLGNLTALNHATQQWFPTFFHWSPPLPVSNTSQVPPNPNPHTLNEKSD